MSFTARLNVLSVLRVVAMLFVLALPLPAHATTDPPCDVALGGPNDGHYTEMLGHFAYQGVDESKNPYYTNEGGYYLYLHSEFWYVNKTNSSGKNYQQAYYLSLIKYGKANMPVKPII